MRATQPRVLAAASVILLAAPLQAQVVTEMAPERIREAIADSKGESCYPLKNHGCFTTPYSRVVQAARAAKKKYQPFTEGDATPEMLASKIEVLAFPQRSFVMGRGRVGPPIDVTAVVVIPAKAKDPAAAIQPTERSDLDSCYQNLLGATFEAKGLVASFPLSVLNEGNEVRFVYAGKGCADWKNKLSEECAFGFKLKNVK